MPSKPSSDSRSKKNSSKIAVSRTSNLRFATEDGPPAKKQKLKTLSAISRPPVFDLSGSQPKSASQSSATSQNSDTKGKARPVPPHPKNLSTQKADADEQLWVDKYEPQITEELCVHVQKVKDIRQWLSDAMDGGPSGKLRYYRRILVLTGPAGTGKTSTLRVLSREMDFDILEWRNSSDERFDSEQRGEYEGLSDKFQKFFARATSCSALSFDSMPSDGALPLSQGSTSKGSMPPPPVPPHASRRRQVVLLEDLPNILHAATQESFHASLRRLVESSVVPASPVVVIISDAGTRGEDGEDTIGGSFSSWKGKGRDVVDIRTVLPSSVLLSPYVTQISLNPIARTLLMKGLKRIVEDQHTSSGGLHLSKDVLELIADSSNGDIRSAVMALQFACTPVSRSSSTKTKDKKSRKASDARAVLEAVTRREQSLALFHLVGKVLYNKRKGDAPASSTSARDAQKERDADARLKDPPSLPPHLKDHEREASRVNVEAIYADSPVDASLLSHYIHQNYVQYCDELDQCGDVVDWLSWVDANGGESWQQANPHRFHLVTLGTMHSLPHPVTRRGQKTYKPEFFDVFKREREAMDGVRDVHNWLRHENLSLRLAGRDIATDLPAVLKAMDLNKRGDARPPPTHALFSKLVFMQNTGATGELADEHEPLPEASLTMLEDGLADVESLHAPQDPEAEADHGGWLEEDDIEDA